ncbi:methylated-DNA--[protein]-cysteine S-methyltransferase [Yunchengibacter salinarum]|uniref:methylated-DNA--[protein]-cysteine S-methyltransferase n=1 Tax=Yunchengibacter salinarum TaxID=3133399 RepID=UPI0035B64BCD
MHTPIGDLTLFDQRGAITALSFGWCDLQEPSFVLQQAKDQIDAYFDGHRTGFNLPLAPFGTDYQKRVWRALARIPYGETRQYGELAAELGSAPRAIGGACGRNPLPILLPCHRVLAADGGLGGYSGEGGVDTKKALLILEGALPVPT